MVLLGILASAGSFTVFLIPQHGDRITSETCDKIRDGMTAEEVEELLGCPPGDYATGEVWYMYMIIGRNPRPTRRWANNGGEIEVTLDDAGRVSDKHFATGVLVHEETLQEKLRRLLRL